MSDLYLFDHEVNYYRHGCTDDAGEFDPEKAATLGFAESQFPAIIAILSNESAPAPVTESVEEANDSEE